MIKSRIFSILLIWMFVQTISAQRPVWNKLSPMVREACQVAMDSVGKTRAETNVHGASKLIAFVRTTEEGSGVLKEQGCRELARYGSLYIAEIPLSRIAALSVDSRIRRIEAGHRAKACMDTTSLIVHAPAVYQGLDLSKAYTGSGVVVGVQDIGFDLTHPNFYSADMKQYRIKALWDQLSTDTLRSNLPVGRDYTTKAELLALGHPRDGLIQTHGTHTTGIAAGSGSEGNGLVSPYRGIAYESDICLVCNATSDDISLIDSADYYKYTFALDALGFQYIFNYADRARKPCVINFSEGSQEDFMGYDQMYYAMLDSLSGPGHIIVSSAGNDGRNINYVSKPIGQDKAGVFMNGDNSVYVTTKTTADFTMRMTFYPNNLPFTRDYVLQNILQAPDSMLRDSFVIDATTYILTAMAYRSGYNPDETVCDWNIAPQGKKVNAAYPLSFTLMGTDASVEMFPVSGYFYHSSLDASLNAGDNTHSILSPSSAPSVISVGATGWRTRFTNYLGELKIYDNGTGGQRSPFSAVGPSWDGRTKPDVVAPGQNIVSSYNSFYLEHNPTARDISSDVEHFTYNGRTYAWNSNSGTSMSAPVVTGIIALWLQANPKLTPQQCLDVFSRSCRHYDSSLTYPNNLYGFGEIDAYEGIRMMLGLAPTGIRNLDEQPISRDQTYSIDGRYVGNDTTHLSRGIYIRDGKKFVVHD